MKWYWKTGAAFLVLAAVVGRLLRTEPVGNEQLFRDSLHALRSGVDNPELQSTFERLKADKNYWRHQALQDAALFLRGGRPADALDRLSVITEDNPVREEALHCAGEALYRLERLGEAQQVFEMLRVECPDNTDARRWLGAIYYDLGAYDQAITEMTAVAEIDPQDYRPHHLLGIMYQDFEVAEDAIVHFTTAMKLDPPDEIKDELSLDLARVLIGNRDYEQAMQQLEKTKDGNAKFELQATCAWHLGKTVKAKKLLTAAEQLAALAPEGTELKAEIAAADGDLDSSIAILKALLDQHPDKANARYNLAMTLRQTGNEEQAAAQLARWEQDRKLADQMVQLNLTAVSDPNDADVRESLASICRQLGKTKLADVWQKAADACRSRQQPASRTDDE